MWIGILLGISSINYSDRKGKEDALYNFFQIPQKKVKEKKLKKK